MKLYMFRAALLPIIRSLFTVHSALVYVIQACRQLSSRTRMELSSTSILDLLERCLQTCMTYHCWVPVPSWSWSKAVYKPVWHIPLLSLQWINSWWETQEISETCRVSCQNKFVKLVHLVCFIIMKLVTMHGHMNLKFSTVLFLACFFIIAVTEKRQCL